MTYLEDCKRDEMGELHNQIVHLVDSTKLSPPETLTVLRVIANGIEKLLETSLKGQ